MKAQKDKKNLHCFLDSWDAKVTIIYESKDFNSYSTDNLLSMLIAYEQKVRQRNVESKERNKEKIIVLKANDTKISDSREDENADIALITHQFERFLKNKYNLQYNKREDFKD